jgi:hypothetical protein
MKHELTGRFLKAKKDRPVGISIQIGEFVEIQANGKGKTHNGSNWNCFPIQSDYFELMPEGFKPPSTVDRSSLKYPEKGEYFVTLQVESSSGTACAKNNFVFKQREDAAYSKPVTDTRGSSGNGNSCISFDLKKDLKAWRFATKEEIAEYDRLGIPYDVTTLKTKSNLEKAARLYPIGTVYIPLDTDGDPYSDEYRSERAPEALDLGIDVGYGYVYHYATAKWAEIVTKDATVTTTEPVPSIHHGGFKVGDKVSCSGMSGIIVGFDTDISENICVEAGTEPREARETNNGLYNELGEKLPTFMTIDRIWRTASSLTLISSVSSETKSSDILKALPEKWSVQITSESREALGRWRDAGTLNNNPGYCLSYHNGAKGYYCDSFNADFPLITFEQFEEHVLGISKVETEEKPSSESTVKKFPEKWFIRGSAEFSKLVGPSASINGDLSSKCYWLKEKPFIRNSIDWGCSSDAPSGYTEVTFSELEDHLNLSSFAEESAEYIECINSGKSYPLHSRAESFGCTRYARKVLTEGRIYKVIRKVQISDSTPGYSCTDGELDYLISENGTRRSTFSAYEAQNKLSQPAKNMTPSEKLEYKIGDLFRVVNSGDFSTLVGFSAGEIIRFEKDDGSICPRFTSVTSGKSAYKNLNSLERYVQEYWYFNDETISESEFADMLEFLTKRGYTFRKHAGFPLSFSSFKAEGYLRADDSFPMTFSIDNNSQNADVSKSRSDFGLSATPAVKHWIPEVGEHAVMLHAGGYGYHPDNNGCVALIKSVGTRSLGSGSKKRTVPSIEGTILNPKRSTYSVNFTNIPVHLENDDVICRKATTQEILAAQNVRRVPDLLVGHWYKYKGWYLKFDRITSENIVRSSEHINAAGAYITIDVGWGTYDSIFQSLIVPMTFTDMEKVFEAFGIKDIHLTYRDLIPGVWYSSKNTYSSRSDCFKFHHMKGETRVFYSECVIGGTWRNGMGDWGMVKDLYVTPKEHLRDVLPHDHPDLSTGTASSGNALNTLELLPMRVKI